MKKMIILGLIFGFLAGCAANNKIISKKNCNLLDGLIVNYLTESISIDVYLKESDKWIFKGKVELPPKPKDSSYVSKSYTLPDYGKYKFVTTMIYKEIITVKGKDYPFVMVDRYLKQFEMKDSEECDRGPKGENIGWEYDIIEE